MLENNLTLTLQIKFRLNKRRDYKVILDKMLDVLKHEGVVAIATQGEEGPHLANTWNSYVQVTPDDRLLIPAGSMNTTEKNVEKNNQVLITLGSREVEGFHGPGTGFLVKGNAKFVTDGSDFELIKSKFPWARAALEVKVISAKQTL